MVWDMYKERPSLANGHLRLQDVLPGWSCVTWQAAQWTKSKLVNRLFHEHYLRLRGHVTSFPKLSMLIKIFLQETTLSNRGKREGSNAYGCSKVWSMLGVAWDRQVVCQAACLVDWAQRITTINYDGSSCLQLPSQGRKSYFHALFLEYRNRWAWI